MNTTTQDKEIKMGRYANLLYDETFKLVVAAEGNESLVLEILRLLLPELHIASVRFMDRERHGFAISEKNVTFDLYCTDESGERFIVEMQHASQSHFADRMLFYSTFALREQLETKMRERREQLRRGQPAPPVDYSLLPVYVVGILNFSIPHRDAGALTEGLVSRYELLNTGNGERMTGALTFLFLELGRLGIGPKEPQRCVTLLEKFAWSMRYMHEVEEKPEGFEDSLLGLLYGKSEFANMTVGQQEAYDRIMTTDIDIENQIAYARRTGREEGEAAGKAEVARAMKAAGLSAEEISKFTSLTPEQVETL
ncbi:MAG: PD-(D/E)XK nuclease family transposase [Bacteroidales bacterium]|nr:PD-(D/E)XK nuclease family transposase [Bacteroidales bacterium]